MDRTRKIFIACLVAIATTLILSYINNNYLRENMYEAYTINKVIISGEHIEKEMLEKIKVTKPNKYISKEEIDIYTEGYVAKENLNVGQILTKQIIEKDKFVKNEKTVYVSIPIVNCENGMAYQIGRGDRVDLYYTSKLSQISEITKDFQKEYSSTEADGMVTIRLLENAIVLNTYNELGEETRRGGTFKQVVFKTNQKTAMVICNLKGQGGFDICKVN